MPGRLFAAAAAALLVGAAAPQDSEADSARRVRAHVEFLASDQLEGRDTGSHGLAVAASYVAAQFHALGLKPAGPNGSWYQQVPFRRAYLEGVPTVTYSGGERPVQLTVARDVGIRPSLRERDRTIDAGLVFAGRGISDRVLGIDDYAGLDVRGKIVVALEGTPAGLPHDVALHLEQVKDDVAAAKGAIGYIEVESYARGGGWDGPRRRGEPILDWVDASGATGMQSDAVRLRMTLSEQWAARLFERAPTRLNQVRAAARRSRSLPGFALPGRFKVRARSQWVDFTSPQVMALIPGTDPALRAEHVVLLGHLDHLGIKRDAKPGEDRIYNGAMDNAAGIATLIETARTFVTAGRPPRRSVLLMAVTGEEYGLLGADFFAAHPSVPLGQLAGLVNIDMPLLHYDFTDVVAFGADHSTIAATVAAAGGSMGVATTPDPTPDEALFVRSDHYRFVTRGIPAVFLMTGHANGGRQAWSRYLSGVYHKPNDDLTQPISWRAGARFAQLNYRIARALADADQRPRWYAGDYFGDSFAPGQPRAQR